MEMKKVNYLVVTGIMAALITLMTAYICHIPVGTNVTTKLGTVTTFSRLAADDYVALVIEKDGDEDVIAAVYIIG